MRNRLVVILILCFLTALLWADLSWDNPLLIGDYKNLNFQGKAVRSAEGISIVLYSKLDNGATRNYLQAYSPSLEPLWTINLDEGYYHTFCITAQSKLFITYFKDNGLYAKRFNMDGSAYDTNPILIMNTGSTNSYTARLFPKNDGGVHVVLPYTSPVRYQHFNANGSLTHPLVYNLQPIIPNNVTISDIELLSDNTLVISYYSSSNTGIVKLDSEMQVVFQHTFANVTHCDFAGRPGGGVYVSLKSGSTYEIRAYDALGLYQLSITGIPAVSGYIIDLYCNLDDKLLMINLSGLNLIGQIYNSDGSMQLPEEGVILATSQFSTPELIFYPDGANGFFIVNRTSLSATQSRIMVDYISNQGIRWTQAHEQGNVNDYDESYYRHAISDNGVLYTYYAIGTSTNSGIAYNRYSRASVAEFPSTGRILVSESLGNIMQPQMYPLGEDTALAIWRKKRFQNETYTYLQYNVVNPNGTWQFDEPQNVLFSMTNQPYSALSTDDGKVIILSRYSWETDTVRAQLIDVNGNKLWGNNGKALSIPNTSFETYSYFEGSLYAVYKDSGYLKMQRFVNGEQVWAVGGVVTAAINGNYAGNYFEQVHLVDRTLFWVQWGGSEYYGSMCLMNKMDENGMPCDGFSIYGTPMVSIDPPYSGVRLSGVHKTGVIYRLKTSYIQMVYTQEGHSGGGDWIPYSYSYIRHVNAQGDTLSTSIEMPLTHAINTYTDGTDLYLANINYYNGVIQVLKYSGLGDLVWQQSYFGNLYWLSSYMGFGGSVSISKLNDNELIIAGRTRYGSMHAFTYFTINTDGVLVPAQDNQFAFTNMFDSKLNICSTRMGCYLLAYDAFGYYAGIRFKASGAAASVIDPGTQSPAIFRLSPAYPNPSGQDSKFKLDLQDSGLGKMEVYNLRGQKVMQKDLLDLERGAHILSWNGMDNNGKLCSNGIYFIRVNLNGYSQTIKVVRIK